MADIGALCFRCKQKQTSHVRPSLFAGSGQTPLDSFPDIEAFQQTGPLRSPQAAWHMQVHHRQREADTTIMVNDAPFARDDHYSTDLEA